MTTTVSHDDRGHCWPSPSRISAGTHVEALIVVAKRGVAEELTPLIDGIGIQVDRIGVEGANAVAEAHSAWGKGQHPAGLNFGDFVSPT